LEVRADRIHVAWGRAIIVIVRSEPEIPNVARMERERILPAY